jgi:hypothetical protein
MKGQMMDFLTASEIKLDFMVAMKFASDFGKTAEEMFEEVAKKYSREKLAEALLTLNKTLEEERVANTELFSLAIRSKDKA